MKWLWSSGLRWAAACVALVAGCLLLTCWHFGVWSWTDWQIYQEMSRECHPVWKDLYAGRIYQGQPVEEAIASCGPVRVERFENFVLLEVQESGREGLCFTGITIIAKDGRLVHAGAWSCTWQRTFFDGWSAAEQESFWKRFRAHRGLAAGEPG